MSSLPIPKILILQSLPKGDMQTGKRLYEDIESARAFYDRRIQVTFQQVLTKEQFFECIEGLSSEATSVTYPLLHIECHGADDQTGLILADNSYISWDELKISITPLNIATQCKLVVVIAACHGAHSFGSLLTQGLVDSDRAPCFALLGPTNIVLPDELVSNFTSFYIKLLDPKSAGNPIAKLLSSELREGGFFFCSADTCFTQGRKIFKADQCSRSALEKRATKMALEERITKSAGGRTKAAIKRMLLRQEVPMFNQIHRRYFMIDLYPENATRFPCE